jgi:hypothetical protein
MSNFTFLTSEQVIEDGQLNILKKYGLECTITDFAILLGGFVPEMWMKEISNYAERQENYGCWMTKSFDESLDAHIVGWDGECYWDEINKHDLGARPAIAYSSISNSCSHIKKIEEGILEIEYGFYPRTVISQEYSTILEKQYQEGIIKTTGNSYTTNSINNLDTSTGFKPEPHIEYEYKGKRFVRLIGSSNASGKTLSNGRIVNLGEVYWIEVEPIKMLVDEKDDIALCQQIIFSGIPINETINCNGDFEKTLIKKFMDECFSKEIVGDKVNSSAKNHFLKIIGKAETLKKKNPYGFLFNDVTEEDIIRGALESGVPIYLHTRLDEDTTEIIKQFDPDCEIVYLRNASLESLIGTSVYDQETKTISNIPPIWFRNLKKKCEREPHKIHIVFFDKMPFDIDFKNKINGTWTLPYNAGIVLTSSNLPTVSENKEYLFNNFAYADIKTTVDSWLKWISIPREYNEGLDYIYEETIDKIHPAVYAYIAYKYFEGTNVLTTTYTGSKLNANPRKWEMASRILYTTKQPQMLRSLIGTALTEDFINFCHQPAIELEDVIGCKYSNTNLEMSDAEKFTTAASLSYVDDEHFEEVREFMKKIGPEPQKIFESLWIHGDKNRYQYIMKLEGNQISAKKRERKIIKY